MRKSAAILTACLVLAAPAFAVDGAVSEASVRKLLEVTQVRKLVDGVFGQMDAMMKNMMQQALQGRPITAAQQKRLDLLNERLAVIFREEMSWNRLEPMYLKIYRSTFTQSEVDGMLEFYATPPGQAVINKMPLVMQNTMQEMQPIMVPMVKRIQEMTEQTVQEMAAEEGKADQSKANTAN